jgi:tetratricopeptide (TPR) repeat protein
MKSQIDLPVQRCAFQSCILRSSALLLVVIVLLASAISVSAQGMENFMAERARALNLYEQKKITEALPVLEKLHVANPKDVKVMSTLAICLTMHASTISEAAARKQQRIRAHKLAKTAREMGDSSEEVTLVLESTSENGDEPTGFSKRKEVEDAMREGEAAFMANESEKALAAYGRALRLDPKQYYAALFSGDVYYKQGKMDQAGEWFARAIAINPDVETAYRYWGDALLKNGKADEARAKFIEAVICEPYSRLTWSGLMKWAEQAGVRLAHPRVDVPKSSVQRKDDKNINLTFTPGDKNDGTDAWMFYGLARASWMTEETRKKEFPDEKEYRHSLKEEAASLRMVTEMVAQQIREGKLKEKSLDSSIANLLKLQKADLLEAYVLIAMPDEGIAKDYVAYRQRYRDKLRQYFVDYITAGGGK